MHTRHLVLPALALLLVGCTHSKIVVPTADAGFASLNEQAARREATVTLAGGGVHTARALQMTADSTSWLDPETEAVMQAATDEVVAIRFVRHDRGALEGIGIGLLVGAAAGALLGITSGDDPPCEGEFDLCLFHMTAQEKAVLAAAGLGLLGGAAGFVTGAAVGSLDEYQIQRTASALSAERATHSPHAPYLQRVHESRRPLLRILHQQYPAP